MFFPPGTAPEESDQPRTYCDTERSDTIAYPSVLTRQAKVRAESHTGTSVGCMQLPLKD